MESLCLEYLETIRSEFNKTMQYKEAWIGTIGTFLIMQACCLERRRGKKQAARRTETFGAEK